jgi:hypothetical protein
MRARERRARRAARAVTATWRSGSTSRVCDSRLLCALLKLQCAGVRVCVRVCESHIRVLLAVGAVCVWVRLKSQVS